MSKEREDPQTFSLANLEPFERYGRVHQSAPGRAGVHVRPEGRRHFLSVQWGPRMYGSNYGMRHLDGDEGHLPATEAEIAVVRPGGGLVRWADGDTVQGWCSMERVLRVLAMLSDGTLIHEGVADDSQ